MSTEFRAHLQFAGIMLLLTILQVAFAGLISVAGVVPAFLLIGIIFISQLRGQLAAMLHAFPMGLLVDLYAGEVVGLTSLALLLAGFATGFFYQEDRRDVLIRTPRMVLLIAFGASLYYAVYVFTYFRSLEIDIIALIALHLLGGTLYTTVVGSIPVMFLARLDKKMTME